jgi:hypothetical protein
MEVLGIPFEKRNKYLQKRAWQNVMLHYSPDTLLKNIEQGAKVLNIEVENFRKLCFSQPSILKFKTETLLSRAKDNAQILGLTSKEFIETAQKPHLF